ncbi:MAG: hypothetical protein L0332_14430 [Chloroflexi bacterium]|nr:hypothetical protein [Chloroflexota bacterium]MCI0575542.1 hypothetical protein [Chloroflexota bacterium]MCI0644082.1 hypothetical protein [Chloroflexota bacterium]MCI0727898.1 hypothetical protein [Chloroflexota bacterium]
MRQNSGRKSQGSIIVGGVVAVAVIIFLLVVAGIFALGSAGNDGLPTLIPTAALAAEETPDTTPTPTATPLPFTVTVLNPAADVAIDLKDSLEVVVAVSDADGVGPVSFMSNGQVIGTNNGNGQTEATLTQLWTPNYGGIHRLVVTVSNRKGDVISSEPITVKVTDRELLARHAPVWSTVEGNVTLIRGLAPLEPIEPTLLSRSELRQRLQAGFYYSPEEAERDIIVLNAFDFAPRNIDLYELSYRYLGENIAGFYDPATKEFVVVSDDDEVNALEQWIHAHEFMHALQDQHFGLEFPAEAAQNYEGAMALRAMAEGEAELIQQLYIDQGFFTTAELIDIYNLANRYRPREVEYMPPALVRAFLFAYVDGLEFVQTIYQRSGWAGVNAAWADRPTSTEQILHPDRYLAGDDPQIVALAPLTDTLGVGWTLIEQEVFGEFFLREYLRQRLEENTVNVAATGWGGDLFAVYWHEESDDIVMVLRQTWDTFNDSSEFANAYAVYADRSYGTQRLSQPDGSTCWQTVNVVCFYHTGSDTLIVRAPSLETAAQVAAAQPQ